MERKMRITAQMLKDKEACSEQLDKFMKLFPKGVVVTKKLCVLYVTDFDFDWAARKLFSEAQLAEYEKIQVLAWTEYLKITDSAYAEYKKIEGLALAEYLKIQGPAWAEYQNQKALAFHQASRVK